MKCHLRNMRKRCIGEPKARKPAETSTFVGPVGPFVGPFSCPRAGFASAACITTARSFPDLYNTPSARLPPPISRTPPEFNAVSERTEKAAAPQALKNCLNSSETHRKKGAGAAQPADRCAITISIDCHCFLVGQSDRKTTNF